MRKCDHCGEKEGLDAHQEITYAGFSAWLCWKCIAAFDNAIEDVILEYLDHKK